MLIDVVTSRLNKSRLIKIYLFIYFSLSFINKKVAFNPHILTLKPNLSA